MSDEAVKLARQVVVNDVRDTWSLTSLTLARAVIAQAEELAKLRAAVAAYEREIDRIAHGNTIESDAMCVNEVAVCNLRGENAKLRAALMEALDMAGELRCPGPFDDSVLARIVELRRLADGE